MNHPIQLTVNGERYSLSVPAHHTLLQVLREQLVLTGTKNGCEAGECGACAVLITWPGAERAEPVNSCMVLAPKADGAEIVTIEGLAQDSRLDPLQEAFMVTGANQCGFCTPGILVNARALLDRNPNPTDAEIREALVGNLCRCTGYIRIIDAVKMAARAGRRRDDDEGSGTRGRDQRWESGRERGAHTQYAIRNTHTPSIPSSARVRSASRGARR